MSKEKLPYVTYSEGQDAKHLHLGNLVHDFKHPKILDSHVEKSYTDISEPIPAWAQSTALENYALTLGKDSAGDSAGPQRFQVVAASKATKIEIKNPKIFFTEVTLKSPSARQWLSSRISAALTVPVPQGKPRPQPQIWMLTGIILMTHATWTSLSSKDGSFVPGQQAPFDPTSVSAMRRLSVSDGIKPTFGFRASEEEKHVSGAVIHETGKYPGLRGWAAQWLQVDYEILPADKGKDGVENEIKLKGPSGSSPKIAVVTLDEDEYAENEDEGPEGMDDEYWDAFLDTAEEYL